MSASDDALGKLVAGKYELRRVLGTGSMGAVYEGVHVDIGKRLAIKLIHPEFCESQELVARFRREARAASAVESDHIVQIFDFGSDGKLGFYMVIEYLEGEDLEARIVRERWLDVRSAATIGWQAARGLAKAHAAGVVHRDLKPANVFLTARDDESLLVKVLDFGISKFDNRGGTDPTLTAHGTTLGTPQYMSPEQCTGKVELDGRTDVWSLCAVMYEMLAGEPIVPEGGRLVETMARIVKQDVTPLEQRAKWVPEALARVVDAGLVRDREKRLADAGTLAERILAAYPDAGRRDTYEEEEHKTDISELMPFETSATMPPAFEGAGSTPAFEGAGSTPDAVAAPGAQLPREALAAPPVPKLSDTAVPGTAKPPSSGGEPSSEGDDMHVFVRAGDSASEVMRVAKRARKKR